MASIVGPAIGGILIATVGLAGAYAVDLVSFIASFIALLAIHPLPPIGVVTRPGLDAIREGLRFARRRRAILGSVRDRPQRDDLRDADLALPGPRARRLPDGSSRVRADGRCAGRRRVPRRPLLGLGQVGPANGPGDPRRGPGLGPGDHGVRAGHRVVPAGARVPRDRRRGRRLLGRVPLDPRPARDAGQPAWPGDLDPHPRRDQRAAARRHRGRGRGGDHHAAVRGRVGWPAVRGRGRCRGAAVPRARPPHGRTAGAGDWPESVPSGMGGRSRGNRPPTPAPGHRRRWRLRRTVRGAQPRDRSGGSADARRPAQLPSLPAAALPGRNGCAVARRHRPAAALDPAQAAQHDGHPRRGGRRRPGPARGHPGRIEARSPTTRWS